MKHGPVIWHEEPGSESLPKAWTRIFGEPLRPECATEHEEHGDADSYRMCDGVVLIRSRPGASSIYAPAPLDSTASSRAYVATGLENVQAARAAMGILRGRGVCITYDWTTKIGCSEAELPDVAAAEITGVVSANAVLVILPGARGTHVELGAALAAHKRIVLYAADEDVLVKNGRVCSFYKHPRVTVVPGSLFEAIEVVCAS